MWPAAGPGTATLRPAASRARTVPERVETTDPDGVDHTWVMQVTFILALAVGAPVVAALSAGQSLPTWTDKAVFAVRVGAVVWLVVAGAVYAYARRRTGDGSTDARDGAGPAADEDAGVEEPGDGPGDGDAGDGEQADGALTDRG